MPCLVQHCCSVTRPTSHNSLLAKIPFCASGLVGVQVTLKSHASPVRLAGSWRRRRALRLLSWSNVTGSLGLYVSVSASFSWVGKMSFWWSLQVCTYGTLCYGHDLILALTGACLHRLGFSVGLSCTGSSNSHFSSFIGGVSGAGCKRTERSRTPGCRAGYDLMIKLILSWWSATYGQDHHPSTL